MTDTTFLGTYGGRQVSIGDTRLAIFEHSAHMTFVEENQAYPAAVRAFFKEVM